MSNEKLDFTERAITLELGEDLVPIVANSESEKLFKDSVSKIRSSFKNKNNIDLPIIHIVDNMQLLANEMRILVYGKEICRSFIYEKKGFTERVLCNLENTLSQNIFYFNEDFVDCSKKLNEMRHEQSREAYQFLFRYYTNIEPDKKEAFHWLKKMSYYGIPQDIRALANYYSIGIGCDPDNIQSNKLFDLIHRRPTNGQGF